MRLKSEKSMVVEKKKIDGLDKPKAEMLREEWNAAIRAAAKVARSTINPYTTWRGQAQEAANAILKLRKPGLKRRGKR